MTQGRSVLVFTYGTLKDGYHNNYLLEGARKVCADVLEGYRLYYSAGPRSFPVAFSDPNYSISGEVYDLGELTQKILPRLDRLEGVPMLYLRETSTTLSGHDVSLYTAGPMFEGNALEPCPCIDNISIWSRN